MSDLLARLAARAIGADTGVPSRSRRAPVMAETLPEAPADAGAADGSWRRTLPGGDGTEGRGGERHVDGAAGSPTSAGASGAGDPVSSSRRRRTDGGHGGTGASGDATGSGPPAPSRGTGEPAGRATGGGPGAGPSEHVERNGGRDAPDHLEVVVRPSRAAARDGTSGAAGADGGATEASDGAGSGSDGAVAARARVRVRTGDPGTADDGVAQVVAHALARPRDVPAAPGTVEPRNGADGAPAPVIQVHIGRVDVRPTTGMHRDAGRQPAATPGASPASPLSLSDYLRGQREPR